jgi:hypothetical protein
MYLYMMNIDLAHTSGENTISTFELHISDRHILERGSLHLPPEVHFLANDTSRIPNFQPGVRGSSIL